MANFIKLTMRKAGYHPEGKECWIRKDNIIAVFSSEDEDAQYSTAVCLTSGARYLVKEDVQTVLNMCK